MKNSEALVIGKQILTEDDMTKDITVKGDVFKVKFPTPLDQERIERDVAFRLGGSALESFPQSSYNSIRMTVTLDYVLTEKPDWWKFDSVSDCPDVEYLNILWEDYLKKLDEFRGLLREGKFRRGR